MVFVSLAMVDVVGIRIDVECDVLACLTGLAQGNEEVRLVASTYS